MTAGAFLSGSTALKPQSQAKVKESQANSAQVSRNSSACNQPQNASFQQNQASSNELSARSPRLPQSANSSLSRKPKQQLEPPVVLSKQLGGDLYYKR